MLSLAGKDVVNHIKKVEDGNGKAVFFADLADQGLFKRLAELDAAAGKFPAVTFIAGFCSAACQEDLSAGIENDGTGADADVVSTLDHTGYYLPDLGKSSGRRDGPEEEKNGY